MSDKETIKLRVNLSIGISNAEQEGVIDSGISRAGWDAMTPEERDVSAREVWELWAANYIDGGWEVADDDA